MTIAQVCALPNPHKAVLTQKELDNLELYISLYGGGRCFNLNQNADKRPIVSNKDHLFTVIHNCGILWCEGDAGTWETPRFLAPPEITLYQGLASRARLSLPRSPATETQPVTCPFAKYEPTRSRTAWAGQIGNGMCAPVVASFLPLDLTRPPLAPHVQDIALWSPCGPN